MLGDHGRCVRLSWGCRWMGTWAPGCRDPPGLTGGGGECRDLMPQPPTLMEETLMEEIREVSLEAGVVSTNLAPYRATVPQPVTLYPVTLLSRPVSPLSPLCHLWGLLCSSDIDLAPTV